MHGTLSDDTRITARELRSRVWSIAFLICAAAALSGCQHRGYEALAALERDPAWQVSRHSENGLPSVAAIRQGAPHAPTWVYIEGDGKSWLSRTVLSDDPTPEDPLALKLAISADAEAPAPTVIYLGRPCQYVLQYGAHCDSKWWSTARYGADVMAALNKVLDRLLPQADSGVILVGYSGGGDIAAVMASERRDVRGIVTIAANLDLAAWTTLHGVTPLDASIDPVTRAGALATLSQVHFVGAKDDIVPPRVAASFVDHYPDKTTTRVIVEPDFDHHCCWVDAWDELRRTARTFFAATH
jgi:pimeloyl-ACP methyl ester carboxylesterase